MQKLGIYVYDKPGGRMLADWTYRSQSGVITTNERGHESYTDFIPMSLHDAFRFYDQPLPHIVIRGNHGDRAFVGRLEDRTIAEGGLKVTALGYQRALSDLAFSGLFSDMSYGEWRPIHEDETNLFVPMRFEHDNNNRVYMTPRNGETIGLVLGSGMTYAAPNGGSKLIERISYDYTLDAPNNWQIRLLAVPFNVGLGVTVIGGGTVTSAGVPISGSIDQTFAATARIILQMRNNTGSPVTIGVTTGAYYAKFTNVRVRGFNLPSITASDIAAALIEFVSTINPNQLKSGAAINVGTSTLDLTTAVYLDQYPADILTDLQDQAVSGKRWQWSVWDDQRLRFNERGADGKTWYTDLIGLEVSGNFDNLINSTYGVYKNGRGETARSAIAADSNSIDTYGITRRAAADGQSETQAAAKRDLLISDRKEITPNIGITLSGLFNAAGAAFPLWFCRPGDVVVIRNLPASYSPTINKIRQFYVGATTYDILENKLTLAPDLALPDLAITLAGISDRSPFVSPFGARQGKTKDN